MRPFAASASGVPPEALELLEGVAAGQPAAEPPVLATGVVKETGGRLTVELPERGLSAAVRAKSCLVAPDPGDTVLCALEAGRVFILAVLEGAPTTRLETEGSLQIQAGGPLSLAGERVDVAARADLALVGARIKAQAASTEAHLGDARIVSGVLELDARRAALTAGQADARAERLLVRATQAYRFVAELDQIRAGVHDVRAEGLASVRGENTIVAARTLAKLDGAQVKIG